MRAASMGKRCSTFIAAGSSRSSPRASSGPSKAVGPVPVVLDDESRVANVWRVDLEHRSARRLRGARAQMWATTEVVGQVLVVSTVVAPHCDISAMVTHLADVLASVHISETPIDVEKLSAELREPPQTGCPEGTPTVL